MSKVINGTILKKINDDLEYFSKEQLREYLNQMQGQVLNVAAERDNFENQSEYWFQESVKHHSYKPRIERFTKKNVFKRIYLAIRNDI